MNKKVLIFAGTLEGRLMAEYLASRNVQTKVCVATDYAESLFSDSKNLDILPSRLTEDEMEKLILEFDPSLIVDSTHPYAKVVTENIKKSAEKTGKEYIRLLRPNNNDLSSDNSIVTVDSVLDAVEYLKTVQGNIFVTTGSKELKAFTEIDEYKTRVFARVLSLPNVLQEVSSMGFEGKNLICMQGPFSLNINMEMMKQVNADILVTKESGAVGGFYEKIEAAHNLGMKIVIIGRPLSETGLDFCKCKQVLNQKLEISPEISIVGIGMGNKKTLTIEALNEINSADVLIGAKRMVDSVKNENHSTYYEYNAEKVADFIENNKQHTKIVIVQSGDVGFYSGTKKLIDKLPHDTKLIAGISSPVYFCSKLKMPWSDVKMASLHGISHNIVSFVRKNKKVFVLLSSEDSVSDLCKKFVKYSMTDLKIYVGQRLSYDDEMIFTGKPEDFVDFKTNSLCVILIENENACVKTFGIHDDEFSRDKVPMTKSEIRNVSLAKLNLLDNSVVYDIGAGTGSVSIEMALVCENGRVYAIEKKTQAVSLIYKNKDKFAVDNLEIIEGLAPQSLENLEKPTHAFIGGSSGNLKEIVELLLEKNPQIRIVINAITLETVAESIDVTKTLDVCNVEISSVSVARSDKIGSYNLMRGLNPVYVISFDGGGKV